MFISNVSFTAKRMYGLTASLAITVITLAILLFYQGNRLLVEKTPMIEAAEEIKVNGAMAHLWFEEVLSGDTTQSIQEVWYYLDLSDWYALALLEGGRSIRGDFKPIEDLELRKIVVSMRETLADIRAYDKLRYANSAVSSPGSEIDIITDRMFLNFIQQADDVERAIKQHLDDGISRYQYISLTLIAAAIIVAIIINVHLYKAEENKRKLFKSLEKANKAIESKNRQLHKQAHYDSLTSLPNRTLFSDRLDKAIINSERLNLAFALLFIDLDHFKAVNDEYGHEVGDKLLLEIAKRIQRCIRVSDTAARISGDEFVVVLEHQKSIASTIHTANKIAAELIDELQKPVQIGDISAYVSASIGVSVYPTDGKSREPLLRYADNAMYHAKAQGKNNFQFYSDELNQLSIAQYETERDLKVAIKEDQFELHYLPIWDLKTDEVLGTEALVRWQHPKKGMVYPDAFIPVAETGSLISKLDLVVVRSAIKQKKQWLSKGIETGKMCVNISARSLKRREFFQELKQLIIDSSLKGNELELEITESVLVENNRYAQSIFKELKAMGISIALDDFGTGYSSLSYLKHFEFDTLKIDRSFVLEYGEDQTSAALLKNILQLGKDLDLDVIAEGVETIEQQNMLVKLGCSIGQGYLKSKPVDADKLVQVLFGNSNSNVVNLNI
ncbi:EAL domain-containing protein [Vibrio sp. JC009]|uniref:putative bifunctional diguanylate cyclase/phosphodiesterase n=1 Tax=Vibrio sp. JC009 TaxID=2912314 RepID=UPI0023B00767|nr:EAL domain-containing protein [Vibrio sp. JC009]WED23532.1 EAL domain-containing protein [Vibrio sp. JC009]